MALRGLSDDPRSTYRAFLLEAAVPLTRRCERDKRIIETEPYIVTWWDEVYRMFEREFPKLFLPPRAQYPRNVFFAPRISGMLNYLRIDFKGHLGEVDLVFKNLPAAVRTAHIALLDAPGRPIENEKSSALRISGLTPFVIADGMDIIETHVHTAYAAAAAPLNFWSGHRDVFDKLFVHTD